MKPSNEELQKIRSELEEWLSPQAFANVVEALDQQIASCERFSSAEFKFLRADAWVLVQFARLMRADCVRLASQEAGHDGYVKLSGQCLEIQITEADHPTRKRGKEYKPDAPTVTSEQINDAEYVARILSRAIQTKVDKHYRPSPTLVVNLNIGVHGNQAQEAKLKSLIADIKERYRSNFAGIYVLRDDRFL